MPKAVYSAKGVLKADAAGALGAIVAGAVVPQVIASAAAVASRAASFVDVLDWAFSVDVPLFPNGTGPYNPYPPPQ